MPSANPATAYRTERSDPYPAMRQQITPIVRSTGSDVADALVGADGLAVDAVGVNLQQHGDAVPGVAGDLSGTPALSHSETAAVAQVSTAPRQR